MENLVKEEKFTELNNLLDLINDKCEDFLLHGREEIKTYPAIERKIVKDYENKISTMVLSYLNSESVIFSAQIDFFYKCIEVNSYHEGKRKDDDDVLFSCDSGYERDNLYKKIRNLVQEDNIPIWKEKVIADFINYLDLMILFWRTKM